MGEIALTYVPASRLGWWGSEDKRVRCVYDDKVVFTQEKAEIAAERIRGQGVPTMKAYQGLCGYWHVRHKGRRRWR